MTGDVTLEASAPDEARCVPGRLSTVSFFFFFVKKNVLPLHKVRFLHGIGDNWLASPGTCFGAVS